MTTTRKTSGPSHSRTTGERNKKAGSAAHSDNRKAGSKKAEAKSEAIWLAAQQAQPAAAAAPYPGYEPYDVVQVNDVGTWADFETIRTSEEGEQARKLCDLTGPRTYRIVAADKQTVKVAPPAPMSKPQSKPRSRKAPPAPKPKKLSALDGAARVLEEDGGPMNVKQMIEAMANKGYWTSPGGKTPHATLYAAICREIGAKKDAARFRKTAAGLFAAKNS